MEKYPHIASFLRFDEPLSLHTTFRTGGPADLFFSPSSREDLFLCLDVCLEHDIPLYLLGGGSNLLVSDAGVRGAVISTTGLSGISPVAVCDGDQNSAGVSVVSGTPMEDLVEWCVDHAVGGMERFAGLPGSVGGAVFMNARCYDKQISDVFYRAECLSFDGKGYTLVHKAFSADQWAYKVSPFQVRPQTDPLSLGAGSALILSVVFSLSVADPVFLRQECDRYVEDRRNKGHFRFPSAGSMFKNNRDFGKPSGMIIDEAGLRGFRIGDAQVAPWHGNIVINTGSARSGDIRRLVGEVQRIVREKTGFTLEPEVIMTGEWSLS